MGKRIYTMAIIDREGRDCDPSEVIRQIGRMNLLAISGGVWAQLRDSETQERAIGVWMPCGTGRAVEVSLDFDDTYRVRRVRRIVKGENKNQGIVEHEVTGIYCDEVAEAAYRASCWR